MNPIGRGAAAGFQITVQGGQLMVVAGSLWAQIERERRDGPRWSLALREGRRLREQAAPSCPVVPPPSATSDWDERREGVPVGWFPRP